MRKLPLTNMQTGKVLATRLIEIAPGTFAATEISAADVPRYGLVRLMRQTDGSYLPVLKHHGQWRRCGEEMLRDCGLDAIPMRTFYRLVNAGFVRKSRPTPNGYMVDLSSLVEHIEAASQPGFWTPERLRQWRAATDQNDRIHD